MIEALRSEISDLEAWLRLSKSQTSISLVDFERAAASCTMCGSSMVVQKTVTREVVTLAHNRFKARERVLACRDGCAHPDGKTVILRDKTLASLVPPGANYGYDVEAYVGLERFTNNRQREEIRSALLEQHAVAISSSEISVLARRFLAHLEALHRYRANRIRDAINEDGGYTMHIDATTEGGRGTLLVILSGWRRWVLGAWRIPSESTSSIEPRITEVARLFGEPLSIVRDLGKAMAAAAEQAAEKMSAPPKVLACHYHFLSDIGKDILSEDHENLRKLSRHLSVRPNIRGVIKALRKKASPADIVCARQHFAEIDENHATPTLPGGGSGVALVIVLAQWILDYAHDCANDTFPFGRPHYDLYKRCLAAKKVVETFLNATSHPDPDVVSALGRLLGAVSPFIEHKEVQATVTCIGLRMKLFDKFRALFRLETVLPSNDVGSMGSGQNSAAERPYGERIPEYERFEGQIRSDVEEMRAHLRQQHVSMSTKNKLKRSVKIIIDHLDRHSEYLWGHLVPLQGVGDVSYGVVDRTNNVLESQFHKLKRKERRRSGRKILTRDFETIPPAAALAMNLSDPEYVNFVCGSLELLPIQFSNIDRELSANHAIEAEPIRAEVDEGFSSKSEKMFSRRQDVNDWILAASLGSGGDRHNVTKSSKAATAAPFEDFMNFVD